MYTYTEEREKERGRLGTDAFRMVSADPQEHSLAVSRGGFVGWRGENTPFSAVLFFFVLFA